MVTLPLLAQSWIIRVVATSGGGDGVTLHMLRERQNVVLCNTRNELDGGWKYFPSKTTLLFCLIFQCFLVDWTTISKSQVHREMHAEEDDMR